jgi:hypothetical protein
VGRWQHGWEVRQEPKVTTSRQVRGRSSPTSISTASPTIQSRYACLESVSDGITS